ncbi:hypothetical protein WDD9_001891 [Paenibacillus melissococcoides]|nr:hypothetical protein [Paenibacillus melissococcoides]CAH8708375.1 hypothetical protein WDD9_001891 [Paenibacillus melissococcoides]CAH8709083.1 hypothetical protein HTL2_002176 [Paenibacillus melissococcoides]
MWGKVLTTARQYTSQLKPNQIITGLKQAMQENVIREAPLKARKGLETRGYKPQPGERTITREQYKAQEQKSREAFRYEGVDKVGKGGNITDEMRPINPKTGEIIYHNWAPTRPINLETEKYLVDKVAVARSGLSGKYKGISDMLKLKLKDSNSLISSPTVK